MTHFKQKGILRILALVLCVSMFAIPVYADVINDGSPDITGESSSTVGSDTEVQFTAPPINSEEPGSSPTDDPTSEPPDETEPTAPPINSEEPGTPEENGGETEPPTDDGLTASPDVSVSPEPTDSPVPTETPESTETPQSSEEPSEGPSESEEPIEEPPEAVAPSEQPVDIKHVIDETGYCSVCGVNHFDELKSIAASVDYSDDMIGVLYAAFYGDEEVEGRMAEYERILKIIEDAIPEVTETVEPIADKNNVDTITTSGLSIIVAAVDEAFDGERSQFIDDAVETFMVGEDVAARAFDRSLKSDRFTVKYFPGSFEAQSMFSGAMYAIRYDGKEADIAALTDTPLVISVNGGERTVNGLAVIAPAPTESTGETTINRGTDTETETEEEETEEVIESKLDDSVSELDMTDISAEYKALKTVYTDMKSEYDRIKESCEKASIQTVDAEGVSAQDIYEQRGDDEILPDAPTGYHLSELKNAVLDGDMRIGITVNDSNYVRVTEGETSETDVYEQVLSVKDGADFTVPVVKNLGVALVPLTFYEEYGDPGTDLRLEIPDSVTVLQTNDTLIPADDTDSGNSRDIHIEDGSLSSYVVLVAAREDFDVSLTAKEPDGNTITKTVHIKLSGPVNESRFYSAEDTVEAVQEDIRKNETDAAQIFAALPESDAKWVEYFEEFISEGGEYYPSVFKAWLKNKLGLFDVNAISNETEISSPGFTTILSVDTTPPDDVPDSKKSKYSSHKSEYEKEVEQTAEALFGKQDDYDEKKEQYLQTAAFMVGTYESWMRDNYPELFEDDRHKITADCFPDVTGIDGGTLFAADESINSFNGYPLYCLNHQAFAWTTPQMSYGGKTFIGALAEALQGLGDTGEGTAECGETHGGRNGAGGGTHLSNQQTIWGYTGNLGGGDAGDEEAWFGCWYTCTSDDDSAPYNKHSWGRWQDVMVILKGLPDDDTPTDGNKTTEFTDEVELEDEFTIRVHKTSTVDGKPLSGLTFHVSVKGGMSGGSETGPYEWHIGAGEHKLGVDAFTSQNNYVKKVTVPGTNHTYNEPTRSSYKAYLEQESGVCDEPKCPYYQQHHYSDKLKTEYDKNGNGILDSAEDIIGGSGFSKPEYDESEADITTDASGYAEVTFNVYAAGRATVTGGQAAATAAAQANLQEAVSQLQSVEFTITETNTKHGFSWTGPGQFSNPQESGRVYTQSHTVELGGTYTFEVENENWSGKVEWEKLDYYTGGRLTEDTKYNFYEWNNGRYEISPNYEVVRRDDGIYTVRKKGNLLDNSVGAGDYNRGGSRADLGRVFYTEANQGKFKIEEAGSAYGYTTSTSDAASTAPWSQEFVIDAEIKDYSFTKDGANKAQVDANRPWRTKIEIKKTDAETGQVIAANATWDLYEWDENQDKFVVSPNFEIVRSGDKYVIQAKGENWYHKPTGGWITFEDTAGDARTPTDNNQDHTTSAHPDYYPSTRIGDGIQARSDRHSTNDGEFIIVERHAPDQYYGDWTDNEEWNYYAKWIEGHSPLETGAVIGKRAYYIRIDQSKDGQTIQLSNKNYNADIYESGHAGGTPIRTADGQDAVVVINNGGAAKDSSRSYHYLEDSEYSYSLVPKDNVFQNAHCAYIAFDSFDWSYTVSTYKDSTIDNTPLGGATFHVKVEHDTKYESDVTRIADIPSRWNTKLSSRWYLGIDPAEPHYLNPHNIGTAPLKPNFYTWVTYTLKNPQQQKTAHSFVVPLKGYEQYLEQDTATCNVEGCPYFGQMHYKAKLKAGVDTDSNGLVNALEVNQKGQIKGTPYKSDGVYAADGYTPVGEGNMTTDAQGNTHMTYYLHWQGSYISTTSMDDAKNHVSQEKSKWQTEFNTLNFNMGEISKDKNSDNGIDGFSKTGKGTYTNGQDGYSDPHVATSTGDQHTTVTHNESIGGNTQLDVENENWNGIVQWEKIDYFTGGRLTEDTNFVFKEWSQKANGYVVSPNYEVVRLENGTYTVRCINPAYDRVNTAGDYYPQYHTTPFANTDKHTYTHREDLGRVYYTLDNLGKYRIEETDSAYGYTESTNNETTTPRWSVEFVIDRKVHDYTFAVDGNEAAKVDENRPWRTRVLIKKTDSESGEVIEADATWDLYEWDEAQDAFVISANYQIVRQGDSYTVVPKDIDWRHKPADGWIVFEDSYGDARTESDINQDHTNSAHPDYYDTRIYEDATEGREDRAYTNDGEFIIVERNAPKGYYGDWTKSVDSSYYDKWINDHDPRETGSDITKRAYYIRITKELDEKTINLDNADWNADVYPAGTKGGTRIITPDGEGVVVITENGAKKDPTRDYYYHVDSDYLWTMEPKENEFQNNRVVYTAYDSLDVTYTVSVYKDSTIDNTPLEGADFHIKVDGDTSFESEVTEHEMADRWGYPLSSRWYVGTKGHSIGTEPLNYISHVEISRKDNGVIKTHTYIEPLNGYEKYLVQEDHVCDFPGCDYQVAGMAHYKNELKPGVDQDGNGLVDELEVWYTNRYEGEDGKQDDIVDPEFDTSEGDMTTDETGNAHCTFYMHWQGSYLSTLSQEDADKHMQEEKEKWRQYFEDLGFIVTETSTDKNGDNGIDGFSKTGHGEYSDQPGYSDPHVETSTGDQKTTVLDDDATQLDVENENWNGIVQWEKIDYYTGGRLTEDTDFDIMEWSEKAGGKYVVSPNYEVVRLEDGTYTVRCINPDYDRVPTAGDYYPEFHTTPFAGDTGHSYQHRDDLGRVFYTLDNLGKYKIVEKNWAYGYTQSTDSSTTTPPWSVEFVLDHKTDDFTFALEGNTPEDVDENRPWRTKLLINKTDSETGEIISGDTQWDLYEWDESQQAFVVSTHYEMSRVDGGSYTVVPKGEDWRNKPGDGYLAFEDTYGDARTPQDKDNDHTTQEHPDYYADSALDEFDNRIYGDATEARKDRAYTNDGEFIIVERKAPNGYYGDWQDVHDPGEAGKDFGKRAYYIRLTPDLDEKTVYLSNNQWNADIMPEGTEGGSRIITPDGEGVVVITEKGMGKDATREYNTDNAGKANNENEYTMTPNVSDKSDETLQEQNRGKLDENNVVQNDRILGEISLSKIDLDAVTYVKDGTASGEGHGEGHLDGAKYDLYAAQDIQHPDGKSGVVDYSKIKYGANNNDVTPDNIWHTTILRNSGFTDENYLPVLKKDHLVATGTIGQSDDGEGEDGWLTFSNLYLGKYFLVERGTGMVIPVEAKPEGAEDEAGTEVYALDGKYPEYTFDTSPSNFNKAVKTGNRIDLPKNAQGEYEHSDGSGYVYRNLFSANNKQVSMSTGGGGVQAGPSTLNDNLYISFADGYLCDEIDHYTTLTYTDESNYVEKNTFEDNRQDEGEELDEKLHNDGYEEYYNVHKNNAELESNDEIIKGDISISKIGAGEGTSQHKDHQSAALEGAGFTLFRISELSKVKEAEELYGPDYFLGADGKYDSDLIIFPDEDESQPYEGYYDPMYANNAANKYKGLDRVSEEQAIVRTYEVDADQIAAYNSAVSEAEDYRLGKGDGWTETGWVSNGVSDTTSKQRNLNGKQYVLSEMFTNEYGYLRIEGIPYGQYLLVETTVPENYEAIEPVIIDIDPYNKEQLQSGMCNPNGSILTASEGSDTWNYTNPLVDQEVILHHAIYKFDAESGENVFMPNVGFQVYYLNEDGSYMMEDVNHTPRNPDDDIPKLLRGSDFNDEELSKSENVFYTTERGFVLLPEGLPVGKYRVVEVVGPNGFYNEWMDANNQWSKFGHPYLNGTDYKSGLYKDSDGNWYVGTYYVDFTVGTASMWHATGEQTAAGGDILVSEVRYYNHETLGLLSVDKYGEFITGLKDRNGKVETGESAGYDFEIQEDNLPGATFQVIAYEDIYTQDRQVDEDGNRRVWYKAGDIVAEFTTGIDGEARVETFAPNRTHATYEFLEVNYDADGRVTVTLPLGTYLVKEVRAPYGYRLSDEQYIVTFEWDNQLQDYVYSTKIVKTEPDNEENRQNSNKSQFKDVDFHLDTKQETKDGVITTTDTFSPQTADVERSDSVDTDGSYKPTPPHPNRDGTITSFGSEDNRNSLALEYHDDMQMGRIEVTKRNAETNSALAGAKFNVYTVDDIYDSYGNKLFDAGDLIMTSDPTDENGLTILGDFPIRGQMYAVGITEPEDGVSWSALYNSGKYVVKEVTPPDGYFLNKSEYEITLVYKGQTVLFSSDSVTVLNKPTEAYVSKRILTNDEELPGATLTVTTEDGEVIERWVSTETKHRVYGLKVDTPYVLTETSVVNGYLLAPSITFKLVQRVAEDGTELDVNDVYYLNDAKEWVALDANTVVMYDDVTKLEVSKKDVTNDEELPGAHLELWDSHGNLIDEWTSGTSPHYIEGLPEGDYRLHEDTAPGGYNVASDVEFHMDSTGEVQHVDMYDYPNQGPLWGIIEWYKNKNGYQTGTQTNGVGVESSLFDVVSASAHSYPIPWAIAAGILLLILAGIVFIVLKIVRRKRYLDDDSPIEIV